MTTELVAETARLQALLAKASTREPSNAAEKSAKEMAMVHEQVAALQSSVGRLQRERDEWQRT